MKTLEELELLDKLDRLAAEKVMGFSGIKHGAQYWWNSEHEIVYCRKGNYDEDFDVWQPTRNISQAWECLEKLNPKYFDVSKTEYASVPLYVVSLAGTDIGSYDTKATDKDVASCIVRACLRAVGIDIGGVEV